MDAVLVNIYVCIVGYNYFIMFIKLARAIELSFAVTDSERQSAVVVIERLNSLVGVLNNLKSKLDVLIDAFERVDSFTVEDVVKKRSVINDYIEHLYDTFDRGSKQALYAIVKLKIFEIDQSILELINALNDGVVSLKKSLDSLSDDLSDVKNVEFKNKTVAAAQNVKKEIDSLLGLVKDRIIEHINGDILAKTWTKDLSNELDLNIKKKLPLIRELYQQRQQEVGMPQMEKGQQPINPSDTAKIWQPDKHKPWQPTFEPTSGEIVS